MSEPLSISTIDEIIASVSLTVSGIVLWRKKIKRLKDELEKQKLTEDDFIYKDLHRFLKKAKYGEPPLSRTYPIDGNSLRVTIAHRHKGESIFGVDLVYEISERKIALLQYKKSNQQRFSIDRKQMKKLKHFCYENCLSKKHENKPWFPEESRIVPFCPCYYYLIIDPEDELIMPACVVESILDSKGKVRNSASVNEFLRGISRDAFNEMFSKCWIGAIYTSKENVDLMTDILLSEDHMLIQCKESESTEEQRDMEKI